MPRPRRSALSYSTPAARRVKRARLARDTPSAAPQELTSSNLPHEAGTAPTADTVAMIADDLPQTPLVHPMVFPRATLPPPVDLSHAAFAYVPNYDYSAHPTVRIGNMNKVCRFCRALKFPSEPPGLCCANGKVYLQALVPPPDPLCSLVAGGSSESKHFLKNIRKYNSCFQMTSFGATRIIHDNYMPTFKVQGQIYHQVGSLLPVADSEPTFLQIYFMGNREHQATQRCRFNRDTRQSIVVSLQDFFHAHNDLIRRFKTALERMPTDDYVVVIRPDRPAPGHHPGRGRLSFQSDATRSRNQRGNNQKGLPPHILTLKIGVPIILLRNIHPPRLCNGTRLAVKNLRNNVIEATILTGNYSGEDVLLPRIPLRPNDTPVDFNRLQFPVRLAFAMTINKAQGQSLKTCGLHLESPCFSHGQLYVACSRVGKPTDLFVLAQNGVTKNIVYPRALQ